MKNVIIQFEITPKIILRVLIIFVVILIAMGIISAIIEVSQKSRGIEYGYFLSNFGKKFHLNSEMSFPAYFSSLYFLLAALILGFISFLNKNNGAKYWKYWFLLTVLFLFLSMDEMLAIHEEFTDYLRIVLDISGPGQYAWAIIGTACVMVLFMAFSKFIFSLPNKTRLRFFISAAVFLGGALGTEFIGGYVRDLDTNALYHNIFVVIEESMEMIGIILFIRALLLYLREDLINPTSGYKPID